MFETILAQAPNLTISSDINSLVTENSNNVFVAIQGAMFDSHVHIPLALTKGCRYIVALADHSERAKLYQNIPAEKLCLVPCTRTALARLAAAHYKYPSNALKLFGVTGTNGKTTVTHLLEKLLSVVEGRPSGLIGTIENRVGSHKLKSHNTTPGPMSLHGLLREFVDEGAVSASLEVTSHALDQHRLLGCAFEAVVFTNLTQDHLDYHHTMESYFGAKKRLFDPALYPSGCQVVPSFDSFGLQLFEYLKKHDANVCRYGFLDSDEINLSGLQETSQGITGEIRLRKHTNECRIVLCTSLYGAFNIKNIGAAIGALWASGYDLKILETNPSILSQFYVPGRLERVPESGSKRVFVDYAHTPDALENILQTLKQMPHRKLVTVFGCGGDRDQKKRPLMARVAETYSDLTIITSDNPRTENPDVILDHIESGFRNRNSFLRVADRHDAIIEAIEVMHDDDIVLIAGKGHESVQIIGSKHLPFDDRKQVADYFR